MDEKIYLVLLHSLGINHNKFYEIFNKSSNFKFFYKNCLNSDKLNGYGFTEKQINLILKKNKNIDKSYILRKIKDLDVKIVLNSDKNYPDFLNNLFHPPFFLYIRGAIDNSPKFSVVGSRNISSYGKKTINHIIPELGRYFSIVSGGASGCDSESHIRALESGAKTISVIGTGIDINYPSCNKNLFDKIINKKGAIVSIFPIGEKPNPYNFPIRNEVVAGLSVGTLVVEAKEKSGSLITANLCLDLGKDLFSIPGEIFNSNSSGCNKLISDGSAKIVLSAKNILSEYNINYAYQSKTDNKKNNIIISDEIEKIIYNILLLESMSVDELLKKSGFDIKKLTLKLSMMEINGTIEKITGGKYQLK